MDRAASERKILQTGWLAAQSPSFQAAIFRQARLTSFPIGSFVYHLGDDVGGIYGVVDGGIGIHVPQNDGSAMLAHIARCGVWFGYGPLLTRRRRVLEFSVLEPSLLFHVPLAQLEAIGAASAENKRALFTISEYGMDVAFHTVATLQIRNVERRIAATLLRVAPLMNGSGSQPIVVAVTQSQLGEMANAARDVVNRSLARLEARGWVSVAYRTVTLLDPAALQRFAEGNTGKNSLAEDASSNAAARLKTRSMPPTA
ncbi:hypothetical protein GCM10010991_35480 [Gemmobacter aquaticus]|uniref:HTH crp-type domain-containing protein n=1 Tax=Gemmobacter aquaticus TaxID=490185 RepID=A0A917YMF9_9RHOB|nr:Crp/Fnr family transcriptional regulator [Gemmobacter aquaticus]GGO38339.1 hypothetical protein GCM10010991_35480 [Gemmobacter aquaticus]